MKLLIFILLTFLLFNSRAQIDQTRRIDSLDIKTRLNEIKAQFPKVKDIPVGYELAIFAALEYFPELKDNRIRFKEKKIGTTLNARPTIASLLFRTKKYRTYIVRINNNPEKKDIHLNNMCFNAQVGGLGHEFVHFVDYSERTFAGVIKRLFDYTTEDRKSRYEHEIDTRTIKRGLGWQCYDYACYIHFESGATPEYLAFKEKIYLSPADILAIMGILE